jgi:hypothetical protein
LPCHHEAAGITLCCCCCCLLYTTRIEGGRGGGTGSAKESVWVGICGSILVDAHQRKKPRPFASSSFTLRKIPCAIQFSHSLKLGFFFFFPGFTPVPSSPGLILLYMYAVCCFLHKSSLQQDKWIHCKVISSSFLFWPIKNTLTIFCFWVGGSFIRCQ